MIVYQFIISLSVHQESSEPFMYSVLAMEQKAFLQLDLFLNDACGLWWKVYGLWFEDMLVPYEISSPDGAEF
ncbi:hypothetical protein CEXT_2871 [Caerostris extrusa]|uniref:Uncharacterized protein n=1 Tax=Caerostris extrusa TaxID=172846 RepID=A0AAV4MJK1_CAEEX|nr:hypothetical protein CEXT_2871 [Caerostris extrusa]